VLDSVDVTVDDAVVVTVEDTVAVHPHVAGHFSLMSATSQNFANDPQSDGSTLPLHNIKVPVVVADDVTVDEAVLVADVVAEVVAVLEKVVLICEQYSHSTGHLLPTIFLSASSSTSQMSASVPQLTGSTRPSQLATLVAVDVTELVAVEVTELVAVEVAEVAVSVAVEVAVVVAVVAVFVAVDVAVDVCVVDGDVTSHP